MTTAEIKRLWTEHRRTPFPAAAKGREVHGVELVLLDSLAAGCISSFVDRPASLSSEDLALLGDLATQLRTVVPSLEAPEGTYFERLQRLASAVLAQSVEIQE